MTPAQTDVPQGPTARPFAVTAGGVIGTIILLAVIVTFVRLGFWQLARLGERRETNRAIAARLDAAPIADATLLSDTVGLFYRSVVVRGVLDDERSIILPGRSQRGLPGIYLITPLLLEGRTDAVLVNRGWVPSPDAATIDIADFATPSTAAEVTAMVVPFLGPKESLAPAQPAALDSAFRRIWFFVDEARLRAQFPYPLLPVTLQERPLAGAATGRGNYPARLDPPALDEGPHLGYALQWFSFGIIGVIGWIAMLRRSRTPQRMAPPIAILTTLLLATPGSAHAQLRPLDPLDWRVFDTDVHVVAFAGGGMLFDQPVPMAGSTGRLIEAGNYNLSFRSGRIAVEFFGTAVWRLDEQSQREPPAPNVRPVSGSIRQDAGPAHAATSILISRAAWPVDLVLRFGATIPTTGFPSGLDRDLTDFFAFAGVRYVRGRLQLSTEQGIGINGAAYGGYPQSDMWTYSVDGAWSFNRVRAQASVLGQQDGHHGRIRGNEDQRELRVGMQAGERRWISLQFVHGLARYSPENGIRVSAGFLLR